MSHRAGTCPLVPTVGLFCERDLKHAPTARAYKLNRHNQRQIVPQVTESCAINSFIGYNQHLKLLPEKSSGIMWVHQDEFITTCFIASESSPASGKSLNRAHCSGLNRR